MSPAPSLVGRERQYDDGTFQNTTLASRRRLLSTLLAAGTAGVAGCSSEAIPILGGGNAEPSPTCPGEVTIESGDSGDDAWTHSTADAASSKYDANAGPTALERTWPARSCSSAGTATLASTLTGRPRGSSPRPTSDGYRIWEATPFEGTREPLFVVGSGETRYSVARDTYPRQLLAVDTTDSTLLDRVELPNLCNCSLPVVADGRVHLTVDSDEEGELWTFAEPTG